MLDKIHPFSQLELDYKHELSIMQDQITELLPQLHMQGQLHFIFHETT